MCSEEFQEDYVKVTDYCHYTGSYQGPSHRNCNLRHIILRYIPIVFHNLSRYDAHLFIRELGKKFNTGYIGAIAENKEKYVSFTVDVTADTYEDAFGEVKEKKIRLRFIDSLRLMASSLDSLTSNLVGVSGMVCDNCGGSSEFTHVNKVYVAHGKCKNCYSGYGKCQLSIFNNFVNLRENHTDKQF